MPTTAIETEQTKKERLSEAERKETEKKIAARKKAQIKKQRIRKKKQVQSHPTKQPECIVGRIAGQTHVKGCPSKVQPP